MLSRTSRQEILRKLSDRVGHPVEEGKLSPDTRRAVRNLADVQRHLLVIEEILQGERGRVERSRLLTFASRFREDGEIAVHAGEIRKLQGELDAKVSEISGQIKKEEEARESGKPVPAREGGAEAVQLKCPACGAGLPMPTGRYVKCEYCGSAMSIKDISSQMTQMIRSI